MTELSQDLRESADFRVRTQAALALGSTGQPSAVPPLCDALGDTNTAVRSAAAAALAKLQQGGDECLTRRLKTEKNASVRSVIARALEHLKPPEAAPEAEARYYVAMGPPTNKTGRADGELSSQVRQLMIRAMQGAGGFAWAPAEQTPAEADRLLAQRRGLKALFLWPKVEKTFNKGTLTIEFSVAVFTYPGKALVGTLSRKLSMVGVDAPTRADEDELIASAVERLIPAVAQTAAQM